jgi:hypothetical protein
MTKRIVRAPGYGSSARLPLGGVCNPVGSGPVMGLLYLYIYILYFMRNPNLVEIWQKYGEIYIKMQVCFVAVQSQKAPISSAISICQSVHTSVQLPMDKFLWGFYIRDFYQNSKFSENKTKIWETLHNDASMFCCCQQNKFTKKSFLCKAQYFLMPDTDM